MPLSRIVRWQPQENSAGLNPSIALFVIEILSSLWVMFAIHFW